MDLTVGVKTPDLNCLRTRTVEVRRPPEILLESIHPQSEQISYVEGEEIDCLLTLRNVGEVNTDPLTLMGREKNLNQTFKLEIPPINPGGSYEATFGMVADQSRPNWSVVLGRQPAERTERTKWGEQLDDFEWTLEWDLTEDLADGKWRRVDRDKSGLMTYQTRLLELTDTGWRLPKEAMPQELPVMNMEFPETDNVRSATHAGVAAWYRGPANRNWWISKYQLQAHPGWGGSPLTVRLPWEGDRIEALVSPSYHKHNNWQGLGYPMPTFRMDSLDASFDVNPRSGNWQGIVPAKRIEVSEPGFDWRLSGIPGVWTGFGGMKFTPLPEVRTPILVFPTAGSWKVGFEADWVPHGPKEFSIESRTFSTDKVSSDWESLSTDAELPGGRCQLRYLVVPSDETTDSILRSVTLSVERVD